MQVAGQDQAAVHELQTDRVPEAVGLVEKPVIVDKIPVGGVVGRIDVDALDSACVGHAQVAQGMVVVTLNDQVLPRPVAAGQRAVQIQRHKIVVDVLVRFDLVPLPYKSVGSLALSALEQGDRLFFG